jgi:ABC-type amino acid transport substrate-binding protein
MRRRFLLAALAALAFAASQAEAAEPLRICLDDSAPPFSFNSDGKTGGFDLALAEAIAGKLDRRLGVQWFSTEDQPEAGKETKTSVAALLGDDRCDLAGAYPLLADALGGEIADVGHLPRYKGGSREDRRRSIPLNPLMATAPFIYTAPAVVLGPTASVTTIHTLADLDGSRIGVEQSSVADIILMLYEHNRLLPRLRHIPPGRGLLERLDAGEYDAVLVDLHRLDGYRITHPTNALKPTGYLHPAGFNLGFVGLARQADLIHAVDAMIAQWLQDGTIERIAANAGLTYLPPRDPPVRASLTLADLTKE